MNPQIPPWLFLRHSLQVVRAWRLLRQLRRELPGTSLRTLCQQLGITPPDEVAPASLDNANADLEREVAQQMRSIASLERLGYRTTCLERALIAGALLRSHQPLLCIGVRNRPTFQAHAWLRVGGVEWGREDHLRLQSPACHRAARENQ